MKKIITLFTIICCFSAAAQDKCPVNFGKVTAADFTVTSPLITENTNAVIIADVGSVKFEGNTKGWFSYVFRRQKRIKLLNRKSFDLAATNIYLYKNGDGEEKVESVSAVVYNLEGTNVLEKKLDKDDIYTEKFDKNHTIKKFAVPGVREGSIVEISYVIKSDFEFNLPFWEFQSAEAPTLWSEYGVVIPNLLGYATLVQGIHPFFIDKGAEGNQNFLLRYKNDGDVYTMKQHDISVSAPTIIHRWVKKDVPEFKNENFIYSRNNFIDKISFQLQQTFDGEQYHDVLNNWETAGKELMQREDFGLAIKQRNDACSELLEKILPAGINNTAAARKIYAYVQRNFNCTGETGKFLKSSLYDIIRKKTGTVADINLLLTVLMSSYGIKAEPVLLSTREEGRTEPTYPMMDRMNYVICKITSDNEEYYLDASQPLLPFGKLPLNCYNGHARLINERNSPAVYLQPDSVKERVLTSVVLYKSEKGFAEGSFRKQLDFYESLNIRHAILKSSATDYAEHFRERFPDYVKFTSFETGDMNDAAKNVELNAGIIVQPIDASLIYFDPVIGEGFSMNPFAAADRIYPVEMPCTKDETYLFTMELPEGYTVEEVPQSTKVTLNKNDGYFEYIISADNKIIQLRSRVVLNKTYFAQEDYQTLRDFYLFVVKKHAEQIVFKKIK